jgi:hypothetical protein
MDQINGHGTATLIEGTSLLAISLIGVEHYLQAKEGIKPLVYN